MSELLLEVRTGGLPPGSLAGVTLRLKNALVRSLRDVDLGPRQSSTSFTGRRLMVLFRDLPEMERPTESVEGPTVEEGLEDDGTASAVLTTFLDEHAADFEALRTQEVEGVERFLLDRETGVSRLDLVGQALARGITTFDLADGVRWGRGQGPWFRPVSGILALLDGERVPFEVFGVRASNTTIGHPTLSPRPFPVASVEEYGQRLSHLGIEARFADRRRLLLERFSQLAEDVGGTPASEGGLLDQLAAGCEIPGAVIGSFDRSHLQLPPELLVTALRELRQVVAVERDETLLPHFLAALDRPDDPSGRAQGGFEWSVNGLLESLGELYARDREVPLARRVATDEAGESLAQRSMRLSRMAGRLAEDLGDVVSVDVVAEAAALLEADRTTDIVRALPSLRGVYGGVLARTEGYPESVWQAIYECGQLQGDDLPRSLAGRVVLLAEHLDTLVSLALLGEIPTPGEPLDRIDRYGARAIARRIVRALATESIGLDLHRAATRAATGRPGLGGRAGDVARSLCGLLDEALLAVLATDGISPETVHAVLLGGEGGRVVGTIRHRASVVQSLRGRPQLQDLARTSVRLVDVLQDAPEGTVDVRLLAEDAEKDLYVELQRLEPQIRGSMAEGDGEEWFELMLRLQRAAERLLQEVLVRDGVEAVRDNRLALVQEVHRVYSGQVRLGQLVPEG